MKKNKKYNQGGERVKFLLILYPVLLMLIMIFPLLQFVFKKAISLLDAKILFTCTVVWHSDKCVNLSRIRVLKHSAGDDGNKTKTIMQKFQVLRYVFFPWLERRQKIYREPLGAELENCTGQQRI